MAGYKDAGYDHNCRWILGTPPDTHYCEKKVGWTMVADGDDDTTKVRYYNSFCAEHMAKYAAMEDDD